jgi:hypothetical protein
MDDYNMEKTYIKQNYMGGGVPFHPSFISTFGHKNTLPIPLIRNNEFFNEKFKIHLNGCQWFFFQGSLMMHNQLLERFKCESQIENSGKIRSWGTLLSSQHFEG